MTKVYTLHNRQDYTDDSVFWSSNTGTLDAGDLQDTLAGFHTSTTASLTSSAALIQTLYLTETGETSAINVADINQGQMGDCFLLSSIGEEALFHPSAISNMIHINSNGTETVTLYIDKNGRLPTFGSTSFKATTVTINNTFPGNSVNNVAKQDTVGNQKEIWPQVLEKAVATLTGGYNMIASGGYPVLAMEELTGQKASYVMPPNLTLATLQTDIAAGDLMVFDTTSSGGLPYGLVSNHAYMFNKLVFSGGSASIQLLNPWGFDQPSAIPFTRLAQSGIVEIDIGHVG